MGTCPLFILIFNYSRDDPLEWVDNADMMLDTADYHPLHGHILEMYLDGTPEISPAINPLVVGDKYLYYWKIVPDNI